MNQKTLNYIVGLAALLGVLWGVASNWFDLTYRVKRLEETDRYIHGNVDTYVPKQP